MKMMRIPKIKTPKPKAIKIVKPPRIKGMGPIIKKPRRGMIKW